MKWFYSPRFVPSC